MSSPKEIPKAQKSTEPSPQGSPSLHFLIPSPVPTRRERTYSQSERILRQPSFKGKIKSFCRQKGHGFILPEEGGDPLFVHVSDIDGEFVPHAGDEVKYKLCPIPPKNEKYHAAHVVITNPVEGTLHERWDTPVQRQPSSPKTS